VALDPKQHHIEICSAGHTPAIIRPTNNGDLRRINPPGRPLGLPIDADQSFIDRLGSEVITLQPGDRLLIFTDGLTDARSSDGDSFGLERIEACLRETVDLHPPDFVNEVMLRVDRFSDGADPVDDLTVVTVDRADSPIPGNNADSDRPKTNVNESQQTRASKS
jgi:sigma-B regulation protein RsbU (phosphoserine phosphatase)